MNINLIKRTIAIAVCAIALLCPQQSQAQLTTAINVQPIFGGFSNSPQLLLKYKVSDKIGVRLGVGGATNSNSNNQNFYEDDMYTNLNKWPEEISKEGWAVNQMSFMIRPGVEIRKQLSEKNTFYYGIDLSISKSKSSSSNNFHQAMMVSQDMYTINRVQSFENEFGSTTYGSNLLIGFERHFKHGISIFGEASITGNMARNSNSSEFLIYNWDAFAEEFVEQDQQPQFKDQDQPWQKGINWTPRVDLYVAYTFGSKE